MHALFAVCVGPDPLGRNNNLLLEIHPQQTNEKTSRGYRKFNRKEVSDGNVNLRVSKPHNSTTPTNNKSRQKRTHNNLEKTDSTVPGNRSTSSSVLTNTTTVVQQRDSHHVDDNNVLQGDVRVDAGEQKEIYYSKKLSDPVIVLIQTCMLLRRCFPRSRLPVPSAEGILRCPLPKGKLEDNFHKL
ncbi:unnamed protein product [Trichobilharzia regenti]|nr:unnamed protein product [Trichobilharzia regenti]